MKDKNDISCLNWYANSILQELKMDFEYDDLVVIAEALDRAYEAGYDSASAEYTEYY